MRCEAFILCWNEAETIRLTLEHYFQFCERITVFDNYSTDGSDRIAAQSCAKVIKFGVKGMLSDAHYLRIKNHCWKQSSADWVFVVDADEILYHPEIKTILNEEYKKGATVMKTKGVNVYSTEMPVGSFLDIRSGYFDVNYSKKAIFNPEKIKDINYSYGCHFARPVGHVVESEEIIYLLHYRGIGGYERTQDRHAQYRKRMSEDNKRLGLGIHYTWDDERRKREWYEHLDNCTAFSQLGIY